MILDNIIQWSLTYPEYAFIQPCVKAPVRMSNYKGVSLIKETQLNGWSTWEWGVIRINAAQLNIEMN